MDKLKLFIAFVLSVCLIFMFSHGANQYIVNTTDEIINVPHKSGQFDANVRNESTKSVFAIRRSSNHDNCGTYIERNLDVHLYETVLRKIIKTCFGKGNINESEIILNKVFLNQNLKNISCEKTEPKYLEKFQPLVALASFPGSGNTWTRVLLEGLTGIHTGSIYEDTMANFDGSKRCPTKAGVFIVKTHETQDLVQRRGCPNATFSGAIFILRNPYDAFVAEFNRRHGGKVGFASKEAYNSSKWKEFANVNRSNKWRQMVYFWLKQFKRPIHVLVYEDLKYNPMLEMYKTATFLNVDITLRKLYCLVSEPREQYHRGKKPDWMTKAKLFGRQMIAKTNENLMFFSQQFGHNISSTFINYILL